MTLRPKSGKKYGLCLAAAGIFLFAGFYSVFASTTNGTIDSVNKYAWGSQLGWVNFGATNGNVQITNTALAGYAWAQNYGWINLNPSQSGVFNDGNGNLSGNAWGEKIGFVDFSNVKINSSGKFTGSATTNSLGTISFDCANCVVTTDWRPQAATSTTVSSPTVSSGGGGGALSYSPPVPAPVNSPSVVLQKAQDLLRSLLSLLPGYSSPQTSGVNLPGIPGEEPSSITMNGGWDLLSPENISNFALNPLPKEISFYVAKFPSLKGILQDMGIIHEQDLEKLKGAEISLPNFSESLGQEIPVGPLSQLSLELKNKIPEDVIFARLAGEKIDLNNSIKISDRGDVSSQVRAAAGAPLYLVVKPSKPALRVSGYLIFNSRSGIQGKEVGLSGQVGAAEAEALSRYHFLSAYGLASISETAYKPVLAVAQSGANRAVNLLNFDYLDSGGGVYVADVQMPVAAGSYTIVARVDFQDKSLPSQNINLNVLIDPEGYVYENSSDGQVRILGAKVSLYYLDMKSGQYAIWPGNDYNEDNPQVTDVRGTYSFMVPAGTYFITVDAKGYDFYKGVPFEITNGGRGIQLPIGVKSHFDIIKAIDWKTILLIIVSALLILSLFHGWRIKKIDWIKTAS